MEEIIELAYRKPGVPRRGRGKQFSRGPLQPGLAPKKVDLEAAFLDNMRTYEDITAYMMKSYRVNQGE